MARGIARSSFFRFLIGGGSTTLVSYLVYLLFLRPAGPQIAYAIAFAIGVVWSYAINTLYVFRRPWSWRKLMRFPLVYAVQYVLSAVLLEVLIRWAGVPASFAPLLIVVITTPITYWLARAAVVGRERAVSRVEP